MIWLADLLEPSENFQKFFTREDNKILDYRNVWLVNYRNFGDSDHHDSFALEVRNFTIDIISIIIYNNMSLICLGHVERYSEVHG